MSYDDNGQLVRREKSTGEVTGYEWNDQGMLVKVILPTGEPVEYEYDGNRRLISRKSSDGVDNFVQSGWDIMTKTDDLGKRTYYTGSSAIEDRESVKYFHYNHRGDTVLVTDANGEILHNLNYEAYGKPTNNEGIPFNNLSIKDLPNLYVGASGIRYDTKTNLHYMRFRWFSAEQMRFISLDPLIVINRYVYTGNNPINYIDPMGLWKMKEVIKRFRSIPGGSKYANILESLRSNDKCEYEYSNLEAMLIVRNNPDIYEYFDDPYNLGNTSHTFDKFSGKLTEPIVIDIPTWFNDDLATIVFIEELDHYQYFYDIHKAGKGQNVGEEHHLDSEIRGHIVRNKLSMRKRLKNLQNNNKEKSLYDTKNKKADWDQVGKIQKCKFKWSQKEVDLFKNGTRRKEIEAHINEAWEGIEGTKNAITNDENTIRKYIIETYHIKLPNKK